MSKAPPHGNKKRVEGISEDDALRRFERKLQQNYRIKKLDLPSGTHVFRAQFCMDCSPEIPVSLQIWKTNSIFIQGSPKISKTGFDAESAAIFDMAEKSIDATPDPDESPYKLRAGTLFAYLKRLNLRNEVDRMVVVSIGDIILDLLLCHKIDTLTLNRKFFDAYLPDKITEINKDETVYRDDEINRLHRLRNRIAHGGSLITESEAGWAKELIEDVIEHI